MRTKHRLLRYLLGASPGLALVAILLACLPSAAFAASTSGVPQSVPAHATSNSAGQSSPGVSNSPDIFIGCVYTGDKPFKLTVNSHTLYGQGWITSCSSPAPSECKVGVYLWENGPYGWYELPGGNGGSYGPCTVNKRVEAKYSCSPSDSNEFQTEVTLTVIVGGSYDASAIYIDPPSSFDCD